MDTIKHFDRFISIKDVMLITSISKSQIYALGKKNLFPKPYNLSDTNSSRCSRWSFLEVNEWVSEKMNQKKIA